METKCIFNATKKDIFNAKSASIAVRDILGETVNVTGCFVAVNEGVRKVTGEPCDIGYLITDRGVVGFSSEVALKAMESFAEYLADSAPESVSVVFTEHKGTNGMFYRFEIV